MTFGMEFHDSRLKECRVDANGHGYLLFRAPVYRSEGRVFIDAQESGWQNIRFELEGASIEGTVVALDEYAANGEFWSDGSSQNGVMGLPVDVSGDICFELVLAPDFNTVKIHAKHARSSFEGDFELEAVWDAEGKIVRPGRE